MATASSPSAALTLLEGLLPAVAPGQLGTLASERQHALWMSAVQTLVQQRANEATFARTLDDLAKAGILPETHAWAPQALTELMRVKRWPAVLSMLNALPVARWNALPYSLLGALVAHDAPDTVLRPVAAMPGHVLDRVADTAEMAPHTPWDAARDMAAVDRLADLGVPLNAHAWPGFARAPTLPSGTWQALTERLVSAARAQGSQAFLDDAWQAHLRWATGPALGTAHGAWPCLALHDSGQVWPMRQADGTVVTALADQAQALLRQRMPLRRSRPLARPWVLFSPGHLPTDEVPDGVWAVLAMAYTSRLPHVEVTLHRRTVGPSVLRSAGGDAVLAHELASWVGPDPARFWATLWHTLDTHPLFDAHGPATRAHQAAHICGELFRWVEKAPGSLPGLTLEHAEARWRGAAQAATTAALLDDSPVLAMKAVAALPSVRRIWAETMRDAQAAVRDGSPITPERMGQWYQTLLVQPEFYTAIEPALQSGLAQGVPVQTQWSADQLAQLSANRLSLPAALVAQFDALMVGLALLPHLEHASPAPARRRARL